MADPADVDVAVVGCGPVGSALAILLAGRGHRVAILERWPGRYPRPRAVHFDDEVGRILQACGLGDDLADISEPGDVYEWRNASGATLLRFGRSGPGHSGWPQSNMFNQPALEALLDRRIDSSDGIDLRRGATVTGLETGPDRVGVTYATASGATGDVTARYVVGCDGANSTVRDLLGLPVTDLGFFYDWLIVDLVLREERVFDPINLQICDPDRPTTVVSGGPGRRRWEFMRLPGETVDDLNAVDRAWELLLPFGLGPDQAELERHAVYTFQARWAEEWQSGRVLLAGDAAHQMPPFAGQGMCAGLRDANNLAFKLDLVLTGRADPSLLETYGPERMDHVRSVIGFSMELGKVICVADPVEAAARDEAMVSMVIDDSLSEVPPLPGITTGLVDDRTASAGGLFPQGMVETGGRRLRFDDAVGPGWRLVVRPGAAAGLPSDAVGWFESIGGRTVSVGPGGDVGDPDGTYATWFADHRVVGAIQRPDFYLFGTAPDAAQLAGLLVRLRDRPELAATPQV